MNLEFKKSYHLDLDLNKVAEAMVIHNYYPIVNSIRDNVEKHLSQENPPIQSPLYSEPLTVKLSEVIGKKDAQGVFKKAELSLDLTYYWFLRKSDNTSSLELWVRQSGLTLNVGGTNFLLKDTDFWRDTELTDALAKSMTANKMEDFLKGLGNSDSVTIDSDIL